MKNFLKSFLFLLNIINNLKKVNSYIFYPFETNLIPKIPYNKIENIQATNNIDLTRTNTQKFISNTIEPTAIKPTAIEPTAIEPTAIEPTTIDPTDIDTSLHNVNTNNLYEIQIIISKTDTNLKKEIGKKIVMDISSIVPRLDIGYDVLHANNKFIEKVLLLDEKYVPHELKKDIVLLSIKLAQNADNFGSYLFQQYYNLVDNLI